VLAIRSILAPTDFSQHSDTAVKYACELAEKFQAKLHLLNVLAEVIPVGPDPMLAPVLSPEYYQETEQAAREALANLLKPEWGKPASVETTVKWGVPVDAVIDFAAAHAVDLIVIATHGRTGLSHVLLGSVAERIVREAPCPVLTIRDRTRG
jgi:nucleotide-binding universal stress UspA family protein